MDLDEKTEGMGYDECMFIQAVTNLVNAYSILPHTVYQSCFANALVVLEVERVTVEELKGMFERFLKEYSLKINNKE